MALIFAIFFLASCQLAKNQITYDRSAELDRQDFRDVLSAPAPANPAGAESQQIPDFQPVLSTPQELRLPSPLVTVSVNQTVGLRDLLFELAKQADIDLELDPQIRGTIIFTAKERPFNDVIERISSMAGLRYTFNNNVLRVELDRPYIKNYNVSFINVIRKSESTIDTSITASSSSSDTGGAISGGGSSSKIENKSDPDLWKELETNLEQILTSSDTYVSLATLADPVANPVNPMASMPAPVDPNAPAATTPPPLPGSPEVAAMPPAAAPNLNVTPVSSSEPVTPNAPSTYSISPQTGTVSVFATERQHQTVEKFLNNFRRIATTQILIEAKVLEVTLTDEYSSGIQWGNMDLTGLARVRMDFPTPGLSGNSTNFFSGVFNPGNDLNVTIEAMSRFGTVRALSSPRVTVLNNQPALVNVAQSNVFFDIDATTSTTGDPPVTTVTYDVTRNSVPEGVLLNVVPTANPDTGEIFLAIRPTVTKITGSKQDPSAGLAFASAGLDPGDAPLNTVPEISTQEMDSIIRLQSGQTMVMGGLMKDSNIVSETGIPVLSDIPMIGNAFKNHGDKVQKTELVIFLRARMMAGSNLDNSDINIYNKFSLDRHPSPMPATQ